MNSYRILFLGDIVGRPGRSAVEKQLPKLVNNLHPTFVIVNGENSAAGFGITPDIANELFKLGVDAITLGNHWANKREIYPYLNAGHAIVRPLNLPEKTPGVGFVDVERDGVKLRVANLCGRIYMDSYDDPFRKVEEVFKDAPDHVFIDFHAEATSEKIAFGYHCEGRAVAVVGTHTHVTTADETILRGGTAYITDVGMCGPQNSVLGVDRKIILQRFLTQMPARFEVAEEIGVISGVVIDVQKSDGRATGIERIRVPER